MDILEDYGSLREDRSLHSRAQKGQRERGVSS